MGLFGRKQPGGGERPEAPTVRQPTEFVGIAPGDAGFPYEMHTDRGVPVRLHDMTFLGFDYALEPPVLTMRFAYDDPTHTPPEAAATPVAVFRFTGVQVWEWQDDADQFETPPEVRGQVCDFTYYGTTNVFELTTLNTRLMLSADRLAVTLEPHPRG